MRLPYLQVTQETWSKARQLAGLLGVPRHAAMGIVLDLWAWAVDLGPKDEAPTGTCDHLKADRLLAGAVEWAGDRDELVSALEDIGLIQRLDVGLRVRGLDRYAKAWEKAEKERQRKEKWRADRDNGVLSRGQDADATRDVGGKTQTQTQIEALKHVSAGADAPEPEVEAAAPEPDRRQPDSPGAPLRSRSITPPTQQAPVNTDGAVLEAATKAPRSITPKPPPVDTGPLQEAWNAVAASAGLGLWAKTSTAREKLATRALERRPIEGPEGWRAVFERIAASGFCCGGGGDRWHADIDWALRPDGKKTESAQLVLEGKFDDSRRGGLEPPERAGRACVACGRETADGWGGADDWRCYSPACQPRDEQAVGA